MINQSTYYISRSCALEYIKSYKAIDERLDNIFIADELEEVIASNLHRFIVLNDEDMSIISSWYKIDKVFLESIQQDYENL